MLSPDANPCDLLTAAAARIRWQQRLLCSLPAGAGVDMNSQDANGLYFTFEDIYQNITDAVQLLESQEKPPPDPQAPCPGKGLFVS